MNIICYFKMKKLISEYFDNELSPEKKDMVEKHLKTCGFCREYLDSLRKLSLRLKKWQDEELTPDLSRKIHNDFLGEKYKKEAGMNKRIPVLIGISSGLLTVLVVFALSGKFYYQRNIQGRLRARADNISGLYSPKDNSKSLVTEGRTVVPRKTIEIEEVKRDYSQCFDEGFAGGSSGSKGGEVVNSEVGIGILGDTIRALESYVTRETGISKAKKESQEVLSRSRVEADEIGGQAFSGERNKYPQQSAPTITMPGMLPTPAPEYNGPIIINEVTLPATGMEEHVIRTADVAVEVSDVEGSYAKTAEISKKAGGYLASVNFKEEKTRDNYSEKVAARLRLRIPKEKLEETLEEIKKLGAVKRFDIQSNDISAEYGNLVSEFNITKIIYDKLRKKYENKSNSVDESIRIENELTPYERKMQRIKARLSELDNLISMSTVTVDLFTATANYEAALRIEIDDLQKAYEAVEKLSIQYKGHIISGGYQQGTTSQVIVRFPIAKTEEGLEAFKKIGVVKGFNVKSDNLNEIKARLSANELKGSAQLAIDLYVPAWKVSWRESTSRMKERFIMMFANIIGGVSENLPVIILGVIALIVALIVGVVVYAAIKKNSGNKQ